MRNCALTTFDNPFNPFEDFDSWLQFDNQHDYDCCGRLDRIANLSDDMTEREELTEVERAIDEIIANDVLNVYRKKVNESYKPPEEE